MSGPLPRAVLAAAAAGLVLVASRAEAAKPIAEPLAVRVRADAPGATMALREELEYELLNELSRRGCYPEVRPWDPEAQGAGIRLEVDVTEVRDETSRDFSIADRVESNDPDLELRVSVLYEIQLELRLASVPDGVTLLEDRFRASHLRRPMTRFEDPREEARLRVLRDAARKISGKACSLTPRRLEKLRERAGGR